MEKENYIIKICCEKQAKNAIDEFTGRIKKNYIEKDKLQKVVEEMFDRSVWACTTDEEWGYAKACAEFHNKLQKLLKGE